VLRQRRNYKVNIVYSWLWRFISPYPGMRQTFGTMNNDVRTRLSAPGKLKIIWDEEEAQKAEQTLHLV
jgi:hypothetical protein